MKEANSNLTRTEKLIYILTKLVETSDNTERKQELNEIREKLVSEKEKSFKKF